MEQQASSIIKETKQTSAPVPKPVPVPEPVQMPEFTSEPTVSPMPPKPVVIAQPLMQNNIAAAPLPPLNPTTTSTVNV